MAGLFVLAAVALRADLIVTGTIYSSGDVTALGWGAGAAFVIAGLFVLIPEVQAPGRGRVIEVVGFLVTILAMAFAAGTAFAPGALRAATAPPCAGASVSGGHFLATSIDSGVNARSGPDSTFQQVRRFGGKCTLAFDGFCFGEPEFDLALAESSGLRYLDNRWLILHQPWTTGLPGRIPWIHRSTQFVASSVVQSQAAEDQLGAQANSKCRKLGGWAAPSRIKARLGADRTVTATAPNAIYIGFSEYSPDAAPGKIIRQLQVPGNVVPLDKIDNRNAEPGDKQRTYDPKLDGDNVTAVLGADDTSDAVVAAVCRAPNVADPGNAALIGLTAKGDGLQFSWLHPDVRERLMNAACATA